MKHLYLLPLLLCLTCTFSATAQTTISNAPEQNCIGGIPVCKPIYKQVNAYIGCGTDSELNVGNYDCDPYNEEVNSVWYIINVISPGNLVFKITPNRLSDDYDWSLWNITDSGCSALYNYTTNTPMPYLSIRCNASGNPGITGLDIGATLPKEGPGGTPHFSTILPVTAGQTFALCILNWSRSTYGYTLDFTESSASIYDTVRPRFKAVKVGGCNFPNDTIHVTMTVPILCTSLDADGSDFYITPAVTGIRVNAAVSSVCQAGGTIATTYNLLLSAPLPPGTYSLHCRVGKDTNTLVDNCVNEQATSDSIVFKVYKNFTYSDTTICSGTSLTLISAIPNTDSPYTILWTPNAYLNNNTVSNPVASPINDETYVATITQHLTGKTCIATDTDHITVLQWYQLLNQDTAICKGDPVQIRMTADLRYKYKWSPSRGLNNSISTTPIAYPDTDITYTVTASYPTCRDSISSFSIRIIPIPDTFSLVANTLLCNGKSVSLVTPADSNYRYKWSTGNTTCCVTVTAAGTYSLKKYTVCGFADASLDIASYPCDSCIWAPSGFTPNGDGRNDKFHIISRCPLKSFYTEVVNRYGQSVFKSYWIDRQWDGTKNGVPAEVGTYYYYIRYTLNKEDATEQTVKGDITLVR
ncbi:MAG: gliding motility-associated C-terminal domain-containing protein [Taibaiella sp.]|nr:gliding motility-associated C-terminal domain-containing protein [Taibaiella sp.]